MLCDTLKRYINDESIAMRSLSALHQLTALEEEETRRWQGTDRQLAYEDFDLRRWEQFAPYQPGACLFALLSSSPLLPFPPH